MKTHLASVASRYATAILDLVQKAGGSADESVLKDLESINQIIATTPEFEVILKQPAIPRSSKKDLIVQLFQGKVQELTLTLLELLCDKLRLDLLPEIELQYKVLLRQRKNIVNATISSAEPLSEKDRQEFVSHIAKKLGKQLELEVKVDKSLIGGIMLRIGDEVIDGSINGKLRELEKSLLSV